ncbi:CIR protein PIR protein [Plasmodium vinckei vinckei]|uniref:CIR protein PIR protein n=1 Tax=Plasmodium vinckei vinckei TaxID=54757 RepID=A0A449BNT5_PLAVN|nr:CIR protein PIR protein [Plasmodium vinckei vinckei]VEV55121.1 CIR protein PIR protein [Plasmodium vinckei vinckei]
MNACDTFREIDELFIDYENNEDKFNDEYGTYNEYCPVKNGGRNCETNYEKLNAIFGYAYKELIQNKNVDLESENDPSADFFVMSLSNILYKLSTNPNLSLKDAFKIYLKSHEGFKYWSILRNKKYFNDSNIGIMNGFYFLFQQICETINRYNDPNAKTYEHTNDIAQFYIIYNTLYNFVNRCNPYRQLFNHLKTIYDDIIGGSFNFHDNDQDQDLSDQLIMLSSINITKFVSEFNTKGCIKVHKKLEQNISKIKEKSEEDQEEDEEQEEDEKQGGFSDLIDLFGSDDDNNDGENGDDGGDDDDTSTDGTGETDTQTDINNGPENSQDKYDTQGNEQKDSDNGQISQPSSSNDQIVIHESSGGGKENLSRVPEGSKNSLSPDVKQGDTGSPADGSDDPQGDQGSIDSGSDGGGSDGSGSGEGGGSSDGSKTPVDQATMHSSGASNGYFSNLWKARLNPMNYIPSVPDIYETSKNILTSATNQASNAYNSAVTAVKDNYDSVMTAVKDTYDSAVTAVKNTYDTTMTTVKGAYSATTNYIGGAVNIITNQLNPFGNSQLGGNQSGSGGSEGGTDTSNHSQQYPKQPVNPTSPSSVTPPDPPQPTQQLSQTPSSSKPQSNKTQDKLQITDKNGAINQVQSHDTNPGAGGIQTTENSSTDPSNTGNGRTTETVVKINEKPSIWCIGSNTKCDITGISIIIISISIILTIIYKYLSLGWTSKSKRKKNIKKVINSIGGKRPVQIIIKSYDRNKDLKPVINSVGRKKDPLLNIYKLMQADPIPFINLFFLLIFFVYKRKYDFLEL